MADAIILDMGKDLEGATQIKGFEKKIELFSYSHGVSMQVTNDVSNTERTSGKPMIQDFNVTKYLDKASPKLNQKCCEGAVIPKVIVTVGRNDKGVLLELIVYEMEDVVISSISASGGGGDKPTESLTFNFAKIKWDYKAQKEEGGASGSVVGTWDISKNAAK